MHFKDSAYSSPDGNRLLPSAIPFVELPNTPKKTTKKRTAPDDCQKSFEDPAISHREDDIIINANSNSESFVAGSEVDETTLVKRENEILKEQILKYGREIRSLKEQLRLRKKKIFKLESKQNTEEGNILFKLMKLQKYKRVPLWKKHKEVFDFGLKIFLKDRRAFDVIREELKLPCKTTYKNFFSDIMMEDGICPKTLKGLKCTSFIDRDCILLMDEISVNPELSYDQKRDKVIGFTSYYNRTDNCKNVAKHALVFMLKGIKQKWKQAIGYFFSRNLNSDSLESMVKNVIRKVEKNANMKVQCLIFDQATPQWLMAYKLTCSNM